jgi:hypothetical protein
MAWLDPHAMLLWANASDLVSEVEHQALRVDLTLGPAALWNKDKRVRDLVRDRSAYRLNPALCRVEELVAAFEYHAHGSTHRTLSTPREACGPELKTLLYDAPETLTAVQLRLLPKGDERWLKLQGKDPRDAHGVVRALLREGVAMRQVWSELSAVWLGFTGALSQTLIAIAEDVGRARGLEPQASQAPRGPELLPAFVPQVKTWETLGPRDTIVLGYKCSVFVTP